MFILSTMLPVPLSGASGPVNNTVDLKVDEVENLEKLYSQMLLGGTSSPTELDTVKKQLSKARSDLVITINSTGAISSDNLYLRVSEINLQLNIAGQANSSGTINKIDSYQQELTNAKSFWTMISSSYARSASSAITSLTKDEFFETVNTSGIYGLDRVRELEELIAALIQGEPLPEVAGFSDEGKTPDINIVRFALDQAKADLFVKLPQAQRESWWTEASGEIQQRINGFLIEQVMTAERIRGMADLYNSLRPGQGMEVTKDPYGVAIEVTMPDGRKVKIIERNKLNQEIEKSRAYMNELEKEKKFLQDLLMPVGIVVETPRAVGDIDGDGKISVKDRRILRNALRGKIVLSEAQRKAADLNGDGIVTTDDMKALKETIARNNVRINLADTTTSGNIASSLGLPPVIGTTFVDNSAVPV